MKTKTLSLLLLCFAAHTQAGTPYAGIDVGLFGGGEEELEASAYGSSASESEDISVTATVFKIGYEFDNNLRLELDFDKIGIDYDDFDGSEDYSGYNLNLLYVFTKNEWRPYLGAGIGFYTYEDSKEALGDDLEGSAFNISGGVLYLPIDQVEINLGLTLKAISWDKFNLDEYGNDIDFELTSSFSYFHVGAAYRF